MSRRGNDVWETDDGDNSRTRFHTSHCLPSSSSHLVNPRNTNSTPVARSHLNLQPVQPFERFIKDEFSSLPSASTVHLFGGSETKPNPLNDSVATTAINADNSTTNHLKHQIDSSSTDRKDSAPMPAHEYTPTLLRESIEPKIDILTNIIEQTLVLEHDTAIIAKSRPYSSDDGMRIGQTSDRNLAMLERQLEADDSSTRQRLDSSTDAKSLSWVHRWRPCSRCFSASTSPNDLNRHILPHDQSKSHLCADCSRRLKGMEQLRNQKRSSDPPEQRGYADAPKTRALAHINKSSYRFTDFVQNIKQGYDTPSSIFSGLGYFQSFRFNTKLNPHPPPEEYLDLGTFLREGQKSNDTVGRLRGLLDALGNLFDNDRPQTTHLLALYARHVSTVVLFPERTPEFSSYIRDTWAASLWSAATTSSPSTSLQLHLLACMIARVCSAGEAASVWRKIIRSKCESSTYNSQQSERTRRMIRYFHSNPVEVNDSVSQQLAEWDCSVRWWLVTVDMVMSNYQCLLRRKGERQLLREWFHQDMLPHGIDSLQRYENLTCGVPCHITVADVLVGMDAWQLYVDLSAIQSGSRTLAAMSTEPIFPTVDSLVTSLQNQENVKFPVSGKDGEQLHWYISFPTHYSYATSLENRRIDQNVTDSQREELATMSSASESERSFVCGDLDQDVRDRRWLRMVGCQSLQLLDFYHSWQGFREHTQHGHHSSNSLNSSSDESIDRSASADSGLPGLRARRRQRSEEDEDENRRRKRPNLSQLQVLQPEPLACPYSKRFPARYSPSNNNPSEKPYRRCAGSYIANIPRLKQHLYRVHARPEHYCATCYEKFDGPDAREIHDRARSCESIPCPFEKKMKPGQRKAIHRRNVGQDRVKGWYDIYGILFPGTPLPEDPYPSQEMSDPVNQLLDYIRTNAPAVLFEHLRPATFGYHDNGFQTFFAYDVLEEAVSRLLDSIPEHLMSTNSGLLTGGEEVAV